MKKTSRVKKRAMKIPTWIVILVTISGWVAAGGVWILELPSKINSFNTELPKAVDWWKLNTKFTGTWTSSVEGWVDATEEDHRLQGGEQGPVVIQIRVYDGEASGEIYSEGLKRSYVTSRIMLKGEARGSERVEGVIYDHIGGEENSLALFDLSYSDGRNGPNLRLKTIKQGGPFLPEEARLHRDDKAMADDLGGISPWWQKTLLDFVKKNPLEQK